MNKRESERERKVRESVYTCLCGRDSTFRGVTGDASNVTLFWALVDSGAWPTPMGDGVEKPVCVSVFFTVEDVFDR